MTDEPASTARIPAVDDVDFIRKRLKELADERAEIEKNRAPEPPAAFSIGDSWHPDMIAAAARRQRMNAPFCDA
jgi:hypothetical protein